MVYIDGTKYACEACVKGHRSSSCAHTERPLFEIKKKGRPVTQCEHCRQLRKTKQVHVKCSCGADADDNKSPPSNSKRKLPAAAAFPDGLKGAASASASPSPAPQRKPKEHACPAASGGECTCATPVSRTRASSASASSGPPTPPPPASSCCSSKAQPQALPQIAPPGPHPPAQPRAPAQQTLAYASRGLYAPPPASEFTWIPNVGAGVCSCGITCTCPGCFEHADPSTALSSAESCPYSCSTCSDCAGFGFAPDPAVPAPAPAQNFVWPDLAPWAAPAPPAAPAPSVCCGGVCKCTTGGTVPCPCADSCCGCCFGCACSDSDTAAGDADLFDAPPRLGFAVSGERGSCCAEDKRGECAAADADADGRRRKRRKTEQGGGNGHASGSVDKAGTAQARDPSRGTGQTPTLYSFSPSHAGGDIHRWPSEYR